MASVQLADVWFHLFDTPLTYVTALLTSVQESASRRVEVRRYANGRLRQISRPGVQRTLTIGLGFADRAVADQLRAWIGELVMYRDPVGRLVFGVFGQVDVDEIAGADGVVNATLTLQEVTVSLEV